MSLWNKQSIYPLNFSAIPPSQSGIGRGTIAGIVVAISVSILLIGMLVVFYFWQKRKTEEQIAEIELQNHLGSMMLDEVHFQSIIGSGQFGEVWKGQWNGTTVALKGLKTEVEDATWIDEIVLVQKLNHPNIVRLLRVCKRDRVMFMVLEFVELGSLDSLLVRHSQHTILSAEQMLCMVMDIARGMMYLSKKASEVTIYRNVLVDSSCRAKAATVKSDVWSFGIVCWEIFSGGLCEFIAQLTDPFHHLTVAMPYADLSNMEVMQNTLCGSTLPQPDGCPAEVDSLMSSVQKKRLKTPELVKEKSKRHNKCVWIQKEAEEQTYSPLTVEPEKPLHYNSLGC
ncbi:hypothetical protein PROFUN_13411 [Planoprotostelium fungivorum]|uniref:Protein kinase domain-containing protein n=1 Tax=Planoprotostelium fungivorum TaxID=1890364 RepID=A0A2P6N3P5_9EUKA|nr:hypothetical protein PROFUN_13411 [Planoprotostelium fungivorum]